MDAKDTDSLCTIIETETDSHCVERIQKIQIATNTEHDSQSYNPAPIRISSHADPMPIPCVSIPSMIRTLYLPIQDAPQSL